MQTDDKQIEIWYNTVAIGTIADMADVAQLVRALDCGSGGRGFEPHYSPQEIIKIAFHYEARFYFVRW